GVDLDRGFVTFSGYVWVGACDDCMEQHSDLLRAFLADERVELPVQLSTPGRPRYRRHQNRRCTKCGWSGHEGEMRRLRTLLGDGSYPGGCPNCDAANVFLAGNVIERLDGFTIVEDGCWPEAVAS